MIIREYRCLDCQALFESTDAEPACPKCTGVEPERVFLTPPNINSGNTRRSDKILDGLAADHGLTNMNNNGGAAVKSAPDSPAAPRFDNPSSSPIIGQLARMGGAGDGLSSVLPGIKGRGPRTWTRTPDRR